MSSKKKNSPITAPPISDFERFFTMLGVKFIDATPTKQDSQGMPKLKKGAKRVGEGFSMPESN